MKAMQVREAKANFSAVVKAAENGQATVITKNGKPAAAVVPIEYAKKLYPEARPLKQRSLAEFLLSYPSDVEFER